MKEVLEGKESGICENEGGEMVKKYLRELEEKIKGENIEKGKGLLEEKKKKGDMVSLGSGLE